MPIAPELQALAIALGLGLIVGLQRERGSRRLAGIRTFPLITILGTLSALLAGAFGTWIVGAGLLGVAAVTVVGNITAAARSDKEFGITTDVAILLMYIIGAMVAAGDQRIAVVAAGAVVLLLHAKSALHTFTRRLGEKDVRAIMQFVLITLVVLPLLPNKDYGPEPINVINPFKIWLMVVLVTGMSLGGYLAYRFLGARAGVVLGGVLGGMISSTATTVSYSRRVRAGAPVAAALLVITLASGVVYARVLTEIGAVAPRFLPAASGPILVIAGVTAAAALIVWRRVGVRHGDALEPGNPGELKAALLFGGLYALVRIAAAAGKHYLGDAGLLVVAAVSGLTDMDAITISTARMVEEARIEAGLGWRAILIAAISNMVFKWGVVWALGGWRLARWVAIVFGVKIAVAVAVILLWP